METALRAIIIIIGALMIIGALVYLVNGTLAFVRPGWPIEGGAPRRSFVYFGGYLAMLGAIGLAVTLADNNLVHGGLVIGGCWMTARGLGTVYRRQARSSSDDEAPGLKGQSAVLLGWTTAVIGIITSITGIAMAVWRSFAI